MPHYFPKLRTVCAAVLSVLALGAAACLGAAVLTDYDFLLHHFAADSAPAAMAVVICLLGAVTALALALTVKGKKIHAAPAMTLPAVFAAAMLGFLLLISFIFDIPAAAGWGQRIRLAMMALAACYFLITTQKTAAESPVCALLSLAPIVYAFFSVMIVYFDETMGMNAPLKSYYLIMYLSMALFFTAEARVTLRRTKTPTYCLFAGLCVVLCGAVGISHIVLALRGTVLTLSLRECIAVSAAALYAAARLFSLTECPKEEEEAAPENPASSEEVQP